MKTLPKIFRTTEFLANHIAGKDHTPVHRNIVGSVVMAIGIGVAHIGIHSHVIVAVISDFVGYSLHAIGIVPIINSFLNPESSEHSNQ